MNLKFWYAPRKVEYGHMMREALIEIDKDHTASLICEEEVVDKLVNLLNKTKVFKKE